MDPLQSTAITVGFGILILFGVVIALGLMLARLYRQVAQGQVLIVNTLTRTKVTFTGAVVIPIIHKAETMDIALKTIEIDRRGKEGLICADNIRADIRVSFFVRVNKTVDDVLKVAQAVGCERASDEKTLQELFEAKFSEALKTVGKQMDFEDLYTKRQTFKDEIVRVIGSDLNGYMLEDAAIDYLEQTPIDLLDKDNVLDASGIRKITELTTQQNVLTNDFRQTERKQITKQNVEADEAVFALEKQRAEAAAKQKKEIESIQAQQLAETHVIQQQERARAELARIKAEEDIAINDQNKQRQVQVAEKNRERVVGIEAERVMKDKNLEAIVREREVELQRIGKEKALEVERKAIADVISTRIAVEKKVAFEEEAIKDVRVLADAKRKKDAAVIGAEADAQQGLIKEVKLAEAQEEVAKHDARRRLTLADAELEAADRVAKSKIRLSEGAQAETAADGLAHARVKEADAVASEKLGMANVRVREAEAVAIEKQGLANAKIAREMRIAEAEGDQQKGLAHARVLEANAAAYEKQGLAEASAVKEKGLAEAAGAQQKLLAEATGVQEKLLAEARGLAEKAESMKALDEASRGHEEFRLRLQKEKEVDLEALRIRLGVAESQAKVLAEAFQNAKINIVGGDGAFFDQFVKAVSLGHSVDGVIHSSESLRVILKDYLQGNASLPSDLKEILSKPGLTQDAQNLALAALLGKLAKDPGPVVEGLKAAARGKENDKR
ncbi:MAG: hypothetical protein HYZ28_02675 [Myxococcales bacterium]|nr:hypothetical protein [Myxococcales bacterium]